MGVNILPYFVVTWSLFLVYASATCSKEHDCPSQCACIHLSLTETLVNCSSRNLHQISDLPPTTKVFLANKNHFDRLSSNVFIGCNTLTYLDLSSNGMEHIENGAFNGLGQLESLYLNNNHINLCNLSASLFENLHHLSQLSIQDNFIPQHATTYNDALFSSLRNLQSLTMDGLQNSTFGSGFSMLSSLQDFKLMGDIQYITNNTFEQFQNASVKTLTVSSGVLTDVGEQAFRYFRQLETLDLSFNPLLGFNNVSKAWYGMQFTNICTINLERSVPYDYEIITIDPNFLKYLELTKVKKLVFDANNIITINARFFYYTWHLEHLSLAYNRLVQVVNLMLDMFALPMLGHLDVSFQARRLASPSDEASRNTIRLNYPAHVGGDRTLAVKGANPITAVKNTPLPIDPLILLLPPRVRMINLSASLTVDLSALRTTILFGGIYLESFNYSLNNIRQVIGPLKITSAPNKKFTMDFSWNGCSFIKDGAFAQSGKYFGAFRFGHNDLGSQLASDSNGTTLHDMSESVLLDLSWNNIKVLPWKVFNNQAKLEHLNLGHNSLRLLSFDFTHMVNLSFIDLSANLLHGLDQKSRSALDSLGSRRNLTVDLSENPLECSCETLSFLNWITTTRIHLRDHEQYMCMYHGNLASFGQLKTVILADLRIRCKSRTWLIASASIVIVLIVVIALSRVAYRHRFEIQFWLLRFVFQRQKYKALVGGNTVYDYDAFVAFDHQDRPWIDEHLIPVLDSRDGEGPYQLLIHHRDFQPGRRVLDNIYNSIEISRRTLVVVSRHFIRSQWCREELELAQFNSCDEDKERPLVILLETDIPVQSLPRSLRRLLSQNTYLEWPPDGSNERQQHFWRMVTRALAPQPREIVVA